MNKILIDRQVVEQALEALEGGAESWQRVGPAIDALKAALAEPVQEPVEPVAYIHRQGRHWEVSERPLADDEKARGWTEEPLFTAPPQRPAEPVQEPVAWRFEARHIDSAWAAAVSLKHPGPEGKYMRNVVPLYTAPPQRPAKPQGCDHCNHPLYAATKCRVCGRVTEVVQEPVAWRWGYRSVTTGEMDWRGYVEIPAHPNLRSPAIIMEPLYAHPPQRKPEPNSDYERGFVDGMSEQARRSVDKAVNAMTKCKPLAEEEIARLVTNDMVKFARAIERAHKIGGEG